MEPVATTGDITPTPAQLAEAPPNDLAHPTVMDRFTKDMRATAAILDAIHARSFAADDPWEALQHLRTSVEKLAEEAELYRPDKDGAVWIRT